MSIFPSEAIELLNDWGDSLVGYAIAMCSQAGLLLTILVCLDWLLIRHLRASVRFAVWSLMLVKLVLPVSLATPMSIGQWLPDFAPEFGAVSIVSTPVINLRTSPDSEITLSGSASVQPVNNDRTAIDLVAREMARESMPTTDPAQRETAVATVRQQTLRQWSDSRNVPSLRWQGYIFLFWSAGVVGLSGVAIRHALRVRRILRRATDAPADLLEMLSDSARRVGVSGYRVQLRLTEDLTSPAICGFWSSSILLPRALVHSLDRDQIQFVLVHELTHWRRGDLQVNLLQTFLQIVHFYNPAVWIANAVLRRLREQAVDEAVLVALQTEPHSYSNTLLNIAAGVCSPREMSVRLVGVVETGKALTARIRRMVTRPVPHTSRLGITGLAILLISGLLLLPMAFSRSPGSDEAIGPPQAEGSVTENPAPDQRAQQREDEPSGESPLPDIAEENRTGLFGRVVDTGGVPVTDAEVQIHSSSGGPLYTARTDDKGTYRFTESLVPGEYSMYLHSLRCVGFANRNRRLITIAAERETEQNLALQIACQIRVRVIDEAGKPINRVGIMALLTTEDGGIAPEPAYTDSQGWALVGGLLPSEAEHHVAAWHDEYGFENHTVVLDDPELIPIHQFVLRVGKAISGKAICTDDKPPVGWRISALPTWWNFGRSPQGVVVDEDGGFTLQHIVPGKYHVTVGIPMGDGGSSLQPVLSGVDLLGIGGELALKIDHPSPASLVYINGRVRINGAAPGGGFWIHAQSTDSQHSSSTYFRAKADSSFRIGPVPPGEYKLAVQSPGLKLEDLRVRAPVENVELVVSAIGQPIISGAVTDAETQQPITDFRIRVIKLQTLSGPHFVEDPRSRDFTSAGGQFEMKLNGPGIYQLLVAADGYAATISDQINSDEHNGQPVVMKLTRGTSLVGMVVDEAGNAVDGATVIPLSIPGAFPQQSRAVLTTKGRFELHHLAAGELRLKVTHPDFSVAVATHVVGQPESGDQPLRITLKRGGTVKGRVFDDQGRPEAGVTLFFQDETRRFSDDKENGRLATATTDAQGNYEVQRLPEVLCNVARADVWGSLGVVRHGILPTSGRVQTLDFGGESEVSGRLLMNGIPADGVRLMISGDSPYSSEFRANTMTSTDGSFTFRGIPAGNRTLYYRIPGRRNDFGRIQVLRLPPNGLSLGNIDYRTGRISVRVEPPEIAAEEGLSIEIQDYNPIWTYGNSAGIVTPGDVAGLFMIERVPPGQYELICNRRNLSQVRQRVEVALESLDQQLTLTFPVGTASISGKLDGEICGGPNGYSEIKVWSSDGDWLAYIKPRADGRYRLDGMPAGSYLLRGKDTRTAPALINVNLVGDEQRTLDLTPATITKDIESPGFLQVHAFTTEGMLIPCEISLVGPDGVIEPHSSQDGEVSFVADPGNYELVVTHPGLTEVRQRVTVKPLTDEARHSQSYEVRVVFPLAE